jgi:hypothetical protein
MLTAVPDMRVPTENQNRRRRVYSPDGIVDERP